MEARMPELFESLVAGEHERVGRLPVFAPFDRALLAEVETVGEAGVGQALQTAYRLFRERRGWLPVHQRISIL
jgi:acyl-CoA reductase-like NAD-dependent aldehyde dehydrogenase